MMDLALQNGDLEILNGDLRLCHDDIKTVGQAISIRLKTLAGEWFLDTTRGLPYFTEIFGHKRSKRFLRHLIIAELKGVSGIDDIRDFKARITANRALHMSFVVSLSNSDAIPINESMEF